jgi:hypothetical protein
LDTLDTQEIQEVLDQVDGKVRQAPLFQGQLEILEIWVQLEQLDLQAGLVFLALAFREVRAAKGFKAIKVNEVSKVARDHLDIPAQLAILDMQGSQAPVVHPERRDMLDQQDPEGLLEQLEGWVAEVRVDFQVHKDLLEALEQLDYLDHRDNQVLLE